LTSRDILRAFVPCLLISLFIPLMLFKNGVDS
jgi:hypothetical protein